MSDNDANPTNPGALATPVGRHLWRHYRYEFPVAATPLAPILELLDSLVLKRVNHVTKFRSSLESTKRACDEMLGFLDNEDRLRETRAFAYDPTEFLHMLKRMDEEIAELVRAIKQINLSGSAA